MKWGIGLWTVASLVLMTMPVRGDGEALTLASGGATPYTIVTKELGKGEQFVLDDFRALLKRATGADFPVVAKDAAPAAKRIFFGQAPEGFDVASLAEQEHCVRTVGDDLYLFGEGANGARYAVYDFLQNVVGFRFFDMHGGIRVPDAKTLVIPPQNRRKTFSFRFRSLNSESGMFNRPDSSLFLFRNAQNNWAERSLLGPGIVVPPDECQVRPPHAHSLRYYLPADHKESAFQWVKESESEELKTAHPDYFTLNAKGERVFNHQYCFSNPGLRKLLKERILEDMRRNPDRNVFDVSAGDTPGGFCACEGCKALERKYGTVAGPLLDFICEVCPVVKEKHPKNLIMALAYRKDQSEPPPKGIDRLPDNFMPDFAPIDDNFAKNWRHPDNAGTYENLKGWCRLCRNVIVWYYPNPYGGDITPPFGNVARGANDIKMMAEAGVNAHMWEHNVGVAWGIGFTELQSYVYIRLMQDVTQDWGRLADEFIDFEYGAAAKAFKAYWLENERLRNSENLTFPWNPTLSKYRFIGAERLVRWEKDFDAMERLVADDPERLFAIRRVRLNLDWAVLNDYRNCVKAGYALSADALVERIMAMVRKVGETYCAKYLDYRRKSFIKPIEDSILVTKQMCSVEPKALPKEIFGGIPESKLFVSLPKVNGASYEKDDDAAFGWSAVFTDGRVNGRPGAGVKLPLHASFENLAEKKYSFDIARITKETLGPKERYRFYELGKAALSPDCVFRIGVDDWWDFKTPVGNAWEFGSYNRVTFYASLKFEGPAFYEGDTRPNRVLCDRVVLVRE